MRSVSRAVSAAGLLLMVLAVLACGGPAPTPSPVPKSSVDTSKLGPNVIRITDSGFEPKKITIKLGESLTFVNQTSQIHQPTGGPMFGGGIMPGGTWTWQPKEAETFDYVDYRFPDLKGTIIINQP